LSRKIDILKKVSSHCFGQNVRLLLAHIQNNILLGLFGIKI